MQQFRLSEQGIRSLSQKGLRKSLMIMLFAMVAILVMGPLNVNTGVIQITPFLYALPVLLGVMLFSIIRNNKRLRELLGGYVITVEQAAIARTQGGTTLTIPFAEISGIYEKRDGLLIVAGRTSNDLIVLMPELEGFAELKAAMATLQEFSPIPKETVFQRYPIQIVLVALTIMIIFYLAQNKILAYTAGIPLVFGAAWAITQLWRVRNTQHPLRRSAWALMVIMICIIGSVVLKLSH